jgi:hypothetical protein
MVMAKTRATSGQSKDAKAEPTRRRYSSLFITFSQNWLWFAFHSMGSLALPMRLKTIISVIG